MEQTRRTVYVILEKEIVNIKKEKDNCRNFCYGGGNTKLIFVFVKNNGSQNEFTDGNAILYTTSVLYSTVQLPQRLYLNNSRFTRFYHGSFPIEWTKDSFLL